MVDDLILFMDEIHALTRDPEIRDDMLRIGSEVAVRAAGQAPHRSGAGAASIHPEAHLVDGEIVVDVSWDRTHYYMAFQNGGTRYLPARQFLQRAFEET